MFSSYPTYVNDYSINLLWRSEKLDESQAYIYPCKSEEALFSEFLDKAKKWKEANPENEVAIFYDSKTVTEHAINATQALLKIRAQKDSSYDIKLRDIRDIDIVKFNPDVFSDNIPNYFLVDLLKLIICLNSIENDLKKAAIFADLEVGDLRANRDRMSKKELFKPEIIEKLNKFGIQVNWDGSLGPLSKKENQFFQMVNSPAAINAVKVYINLNLSRAVTALNGANAGLANFQTAVSDLCTAVFNLMERQLFPVLASQGGIQVKASLFEQKPTQEWLEYDFVKHGSLPFGNFYDRGRNISFIVNLSDPEDVKLFIADPGSKSYRRFIKFPPLAVESAEESLLFSRADMETRSGRNHPSEPKELSCLPVKGEKYECTHWKITDPFTSIASASLLEVKEHFEGRDTPNQQINLHNQVSTLPAQPRKPIAKDDIEKSFDSPQKTQGEEESPTSPSCCRVH